MEIVPSAWSGGDNCQATPDSWKRRRLPKRVAGSELALLALVARLHRANQRKGLDFCWGRLSFFARELGLAGHERDDGTVEHSFVTLLFWRLEARGLISHGKPYEDPDLEQHLDELARHGKIRRPRGGWPDLYRVLDARVLEDPAKHLDEVLGVECAQARTRARPPRRSRRRRRAGEPFRADQPTLHFETPQPDVPRDRVEDVPRDRVEDVPRDRVEDVPAAPLERLPKPPTSPSGDDVDDATERAEQALLDADIHQPRAGQLAAAGPAAVLEVLPYWRARPHLRTGKLIELIEQAQAGTWRPPRAPSDTPAEQTARLQEQIAAQKTRLQNL